MLNPIFWKKVQGQKHPGRWEIAERKIPSVKMLFKTNTNGHKQPSICLFIIEQSTIGEIKENNKWHSTHEPCTPPKPSNRLWWGAASSILNDTPCVCIYIRPITRTHIKNTCVYINIYRHRVSWREHRSSGGNISSNSQVSALTPRPVINRMDRMCQRHGSNQTPTPLFESKTHKSVNS